VRWTPGADDYLTSPSAWPSCWPGCAPPSAGAIGGDDGPAVADMGSAGRSYTAGVPVGPVTAARLGHLIG
jgi:hypothetical protein